MLISGSDIRKKSILLQLYNFWMVYRKSPKGSSIDWKPIYHTTPLTYMILLQPNHKIKTISRFGTCWFCNKSGRVNVTTVLPTFFPICNVSPMQYCTYRASFSVTQKYFPSTNSTFRCSKAVSGTTT